MSSLAPLENAAVSSVAATLLFATIIFTTASLASRAWLAGDARCVASAMNPRAKPLDVTSFSSLFTMLFHWSVMGLIMLFAYVCEYHPPNPHGDKSYDRDEFFFLTAILFFASAFTVSRNDRGKGAAVATSSDGEKPRHHASVLNAENDRKQADDRSTSSSSTMDVDLNSDMNSISSHNYNRDVVDKVAPVNPANDVLNRNQTEEWKGWMQYMFLLYHYYHAEEVYNSIRIMITCYVWMTGFGNFSFFYLKGDYSVVRVIQMLWRLNFLVLFLCLSQGTTYILYYICPLHTYFFLMVYVSMRVAKHLNYTKYGLRLKMFVLAILIYLLWDVDTGLFHLLHFPVLSEVPMLGAGGGSMWEWYFRSTLDHWSTYLGMVFALNYPITSLFFRKLEAMSPVKHFVGKAAVAIGLCSIFYFWVTGPFLQPKISYNLTNSYFGFVPLITYIYLRNLTPTLRSYSLDLLHEIGKTTLETYLMQHHIWLTSDAKSLLILIPGWHKVNMLLVTIIYYFVSRRLYKLTLFLRGMILPDDIKKITRNLIAMALILASFYFVALSLNSLGLTSLTYIFIVSALCGLALYQTIMDATWSNYRDSANPISIENDSLFNSFAGRQGEHPKQNNTVHVAGAKKDDSVIGRLSPPLIGAMVLFILGISWQGLATNGAGKMLSLPESCSAYANEGSWIAVNTCNEEQRGVAMRDHNLSSITCTPTEANPLSAVYQWGWDVTPPNSLCRFAHRNPKTLKKVFHKRHIMFVGDSMIRNLFYSTLRAVGNTQAGAYDATVAKHSDIKQIIGKSTIFEFRWAPLATDQLDVMKDFNGRDPAFALGPDVEKRIDLIVTGGGAWDRLHVWATDEDQASHKVTVKELSKEIAASEVPVVWTVPTVINTPALLHEDKRDHMKEEDLEEIRDTYKQLGILESAKFVLDGPSFSKDRVAESYDGVHYPPEVYNAGFQILAQALDWLLDPRDVEPDPFTAKQPGEMSNYKLGLMMLCLAFVGLFFFDGFLGFSYLASFFVRGVMPNDLYEEAFTQLHEKNKLPPITSSRFSTHVVNNADEKLLRVDEELNSLIEDGSVEMSGKQT